MSRTRIKVCGITRLEDAQAAVDAGVEAIGFVFHAASPRRIDAATAAAVGAALPAFVVRVGVFVDASPDEVRRIVRAARLTAVQLHGDETVEPYRQVGVPLVKAVALASDADVDAAVRLPPDVTPLVDAVDRERRGGTGTLASWTLAARVASARPTMLAGGLTVDNVSAAIAAVVPWAVDVSSGVEAAPGVKDAEKIRAFVDRVRGS